MGPNLPERALSVYIIVKQHHICSTTRAAFFPLKFSSPEIYVTTTIPLQKLELFSLQGKKVVSKNHLAK